MSRTYAVGAVLVITVDESGPVHMELDTSEVADRRFGEYAPDEYDEDTVEADRAQIERAINGHTATLVY